MIEISRAKELREIMMDLCATFIPNLSHLRAGINLIEVGDALQEALEGIQDLYLSEYELNIDIKPLIDVKDARIQKNYLEGYRLKNLLARILDQPLRDCYFQEKRLPKISIIVFGYEQVVHLKICIFVNYNPSQLNLFFCERIIRHNQGKITIDRRSDRVVWSINFMTD